MMPESDNIRAEKTFITRQQHSEQVPADLNTHATIKLPFLRNGKVSTSL